MTPLVKICGLRRVEDAALAVRLGASLVGCVRTPSSPRRASLEEARDIFSAIGSTAKRVLVFRDVALEDVVRDGTTCGADWVQLYGGSDSDVRTLASEGFRVLRVYEMTEGATGLPALGREPREEEPALLDVGGGGSGRTFDWSLLGSTAPRFVFIAGGIRPENVSELLEHRPYGIDLSSGVERAPGVKDDSRMKRLFERIHEK